MKGNNIDVSFINHIVNTYSDTILRIAYQYTKNIHDAQDITQEVFLAVMKKDLSRLPENELKAYIIRVAVNKSNDFYRKAKRRKIVALNEAAELFTPEEQSVIDEVNSLPEKYRNAVYLHYYEGYSVKEIADIFGAKPSTVSSWLSRARAKLKTLLEEDDYENI